MKLKTTKLGTGVGKALARTAMFVTKTNVNSACMFISHQPKLPENAKKLRKF